jgi:predicted transcriptional regulator
MTTNTADPHEHTQFLSGSRSRVRLLSCLDEAPQYPRELTETLGLSRRGVQRNLSALVERGWAEKVSGKYRLTTHGTLIARQYVDFCTTLATIEECEAFFTYLPDCAHIPSPEWLHEAELVVATPERPHAPIEQYGISLRRCSTATVRGILPVLSHYYEDIHADLQESDIETELVIDESTVEATRNCDIEAFEAALALDTFTLYAQPESIGFGLTLTDHCGIMSAYDDQGRIQACVECNNNAFLDWANEVYRSYRDNARSIDS